MPWKLTIRTGGRVESERFGELDSALAALESRGKELSDSAPNEAIDAKYKKFEPVQQVSARLELAGPERLFPSVRAGVDVHGDGSTEPYLGRIRRAEVKQRKGETAYKALRRALAKSGN